jgi:hypothetical protein
MRAVTKTPWFAGLAALLALALLAGCTGQAPGSGGPGPGPGPGTVTAPTLLNLSDAAPDRVLALQLKIADVQLHQTTSANISVLELPAGLTTETTYRQALPQPITLNPDQVPPGTYDQVIITLAASGHAVTFVDDLGVIRQDAAPTLVGTTVTVNLPASLVVSTNTPLVLNVNFLPSSIAINTVTNTATITPAFAATLAFAGTPASGQTETSGLVRGFTGVVVATPAAGATAFDITSSQLAAPLTITTDLSTTYSGDLSAFGGIVGGNIVQVTAQFQPDGTLLARTIDGENAGVGLTTGGDFRGIVTSTTHSLLAPFNADSMNLRVQNVSAAAGAVAIGSNVAVDFTAIGAVTFATDTQDVDLTTAITGFTPTFDRPHLNNAQEISSIYPTASTSPKTIKLRLQTLAGTVGTISNGTTPAQKVIQFTPPVDSYFVLLTGQTQLTVIQQPSTNAIASPTPGGTMHARGLLFWDDVSGTYFLIADQFTP